MKVNLDLGDTRLIIETAKKYGVLRNQLAYILATAYWETAKTMKPVKEAYWLSETWRKKNLRYYPWYGRGYVQLTWQENYILASNKLGVDFLEDPDRVMIPEHAAIILVRGSMEGWFTKYSLPDFVTLTKSDYIGARKVINGVDKAQTIASIAKKYDKSLREAGYGEGENIPGTDTGDDKRSSTTLLEAIKWVLKKLGII